MGLVECQRPAVVALGATVYLDLNTSQPMSAVTKEQRIEMERMVEEVLGPEKALLWWKTPNPMFGGIAPMWLCGNGGESKVRSFILNAYEDYKANPLGPQT